MKSLIILVLCFFIVSIQAKSSSARLHLDDDVNKAAQSIIFSPSDCKYGCDFFDDANWIGGQVPTAGQNIIIDYSATQIIGQQYIYAKSQISGLTFNITSKINVNTIIFQLSQSSKIGALFSIGSDVELYPDTVLVVNEYVWFDDGQFNIDSNAELISFGNTIFGPDTTIFLNSTASLSTHSQAEIFGNVLGPHGMLEFFGNSSLVGSAFQVGVVVFNSTFQITKSSGQVSVLQSTNGVLAITASSVFVSTVNVQQTITLAQLTGFDISSVQSTNYIGYLTSDQSSAVQVTGGALTTFYSVQLNGQTFVNNATTLFGNGYISILKVYNSNPQTNLILTNVAIDQFLAQPGVQSPFVVEIQGSTSITTFNAENVQVFVSPSGTLNFTNSEVTLGTKAQISANGEGATIVFNDTMLVGGSVITFSSGAFGAIFESDVNAPIYVTDPETTVSVTGDYTIFTQIEVVNGASLVVGDGQLVVTKFLYVWDASSVLLNLSTLVTNYAVTPIFAEDSIKFSKDSKLIVQSPVKGIAVGTVYYAIASPSNIALTQFQFNPSNPNPNLPVTMKSITVGGIDYTTFSFKTK
ncbi:hypothetical protein DFA_03996 [Cavenderia fasciculata]|uniref:Transmembrane protein n=1 Tax=Cavenderia fasciculata TaxID=261658 RepID=F4Q101_CACFS|nr:uncharacterized protein DFA_03996 [Cavenderia fasciculata]EGG18502.1 hypothetical protein DFA_03996 [Cavenderia fasciculata]|eukprot:XP_004366406.1 hypothetical protein DFA_03996 [Cavenderia fasciculata]